MWPCMLKADESVLNFKTRVWLDPVCIVALMPNGLCVTGELLLVPLGRATVITVGATPIHLVTVSQQ